VLLIVTNSEDATANYLEPLLKEQQIPIFRFNTDSFCGQINFEFSRESRLICSDGSKLSASEISNVWYRRPEALRIPGSGDDGESKFLSEEWAAAFESFFAQIDKKRWMNHPSRNVFGSHKLHQLSEACRVGLEIPDTCATQNPAVLRAFYEKHHSRIIAKPLSCGMIEASKGEVDGLIYTSRVALHSGDALADLENCPTLFQEFIEKQSDVRITIVEGDLHAVELLAQEPDGEQRCDIRRNNMDDVIYRKVAVPEAIRNRLFILINEYRLRFAAIDMAIRKNGSWVFFEINPNGQWAWTDIAGETQIFESFIKAFRVKSPSKTS
jgi:glutathione synthase/RimK-type ligase-like ATP-grasp enzyme